MPSRPRCGFCKKAFSPNYRNRTKVKYQQRFCARAECRAESHRVAQRRYRGDVLSDQAPNSAPANAPPGAAQAGVSRPVQRLPDVTTLARQIRRKSSRIAAVITGGEDGDRCEASKSLPIGNGTPTVASAA